MSFQFPLLADRKGVLDLHDPLPPLGQETTIQRVLAAEGSWQTRDPHRVLLAYTADSYWRNRSEPASSHQVIVAFLVGKWVKDLGDQLIKQLWTWSGAKITARSTSDLN